MKKYGVLFALIIIGILSMLLLSACNSKKATEGLEFEALENGTYSVSGYSGDATEIYIPAEYNNIEVTTIGEEAFAETQIQSISGGKNIISIEEKAFMSCYMLRSFDVAGDITTIYNNAFCECTNLVEITLPKNLEHLGNGAFKDCESLKSIIIPDGVEKIDDYTFKNCSSLESISLPESITYISYDAFYKCENLKEVELPNALKGIGHGAFKYCNSLSKITIPSTVTTVGEDTFNTNITITVEGSTVGWSGSWCNSMAEVVYANKSESIPNVSIKSGTYNVTINNQYEAMQYLYINNGELEWLRESGALLIGTKYTYKIDGNVLHCTPKQSGYVNVDMIYDESSESIKWDLGSVTYEFYWTNSEKTDHYIYYK